MSFSKIVCVLLVVLAAAWWAILALHCASERAGLHFEDQSSAQAVDVNSFQYYF